jgi:acetylornithine/succinyldiaminopimelate/putrescine aminotransferase
MIQEVRGRGLLIGAELNQPGQLVVDECLARGLRINCTQSVVLRMTPPMTVTGEQIDRAMAILDEAMSAVSKAPVPA